MGVEDAGLDPMDQSGRDGDRMNLHGDVLPTAVAPPTGEAPLILEVVDAVHRFGEVVALNHVTVTARAGEFLTILGESGSGKTTLLRIISGLERPSEISRLAIAGQDVVALPASHRNCTTVFQNYALFPHMSVGENVEYGLKVRGVGPEERRTRALDALQLVRLGDTQGGASTNSAVASGSGSLWRGRWSRSRRSCSWMSLLAPWMKSCAWRCRSSCSDLHNKLGMTFVYITHSQEEALTMSDRIILMSKGRIAQEGPRRELFDQPSQPFRGRFHGGGEPA